MMSDPKRLPLNGTKTHPLTPFALRTLAKLKAGPIPRQEVNPGVVDRLLRDDLVTLIDLPSPYKNNAGGKCVHVRISGPGLSALRAAQRTGAHK